MKIFMSDLKKKIPGTLFSTHIMILHNFCFLFLNWQQVVNVSHGSQYVAVHKLMCHCIKLHRIFKRIYIDKDNLHGHWAVGAFSQVFKNLRTLLSETEQCKTAAYYVDHRPVLVLVLVLINQDSDSDSCNYQVLGLVLGLTHITSTRTRKSGTRPDTKWPDPNKIEVCSLC